MNGLRVASLMAATMTTGLVAGVYGIYANAFMPGLANAPTTGPSSGRSRPSTGRS
jgi:uncharacterized membrane protein